MNGTTDSARGAAANYDIVAHDGSALRRGYLEIIFGKYFGDELTPEQQQRPSFLVQMLERKGNDEVIIGYRAFPTKLPNDLDDETKNRIIRKVANKLTDDLLVSPFSNNFDQWENEWNRFAEYAIEAELEWFAKA
jgi:hypothetical protein